MIFNIIVNWLASLYKFRVMCLYLMVLSTLFCIGMELNNLTVISVTCCSSWPASTRPGHLRETLLDKVAMGFLHLANEGLLLYFNGKGSRSYCNSKKAILCAKYDFSSRSNDWQAQWFPFPFLGEAEDPACIPIFWISKWVDYSDKYGLGKTPCWHRHTQAIYKLEFINVALKFQQLEKCENLLVHRCNLKSFTIFQGCSSFIYYIYFVSVCQDVLKRQEGKGALFTNVMISQLCAQV